ncbi:GTP-binding protein [Streptomyces sp. NPDC001633]|uniref:GTP-binding protein n=1 Tax=Streptomyces sp. NPDC001633 TaxID=3364595 RepID=UPI00367DC5F1
MLRDARPDVVVLSVSVHGDEGSRYPFVQRFASCSDERLREALCQGATGDPAVIVRQDLTAIARSAVRPHVVLGLPENVDVLPFLADVWQTPLGRTPMAHYYDLAPIAVGVDPDRFLSDLRCVHRTTHGPGYGAHAEPITIAEAAARQIEAAGTVVLAHGRDGGGTREGARAVLAHLNPAAEVHADAAAATRDGLAALAEPDPRWAASGPVDRLEPVAIPLLRRGVDRGVRSVLWRSRRPLHPERLADSLATVMSGVVRSRGHLWLPTRPEAVVSWRSAGGHLELREAGRWLDDGDTSAWRETSPQRRTLASWFWDDYYGERRNEIVFTGAELDPDRLRPALEAALLDDGELARGIEGWADFSDPLLGDRRS